MSMNFVYVIDFSCVFFRSQQNLLSFELSSSSSLSLAAVVDGGLQTQHFVTFYGIFNRIESHKHRVFSLCSSARLPNRIRFWNFEEQQICINSINDGTWWLHLSRIDGFHVACAPSRCETLLSHFVWPLNFLDGMGRQTHPHTALTVDAIRRYRISFLSTSIFHWSQHGVVCGTASTTTTTT